MIIEKMPSGRGSINSIIEFFDDLKTRSDDMRNVFNEMIPEVKQSVKYEFSDANPNNWRPLTKRYLEEKRSAGFPETIGVRTGALKSASSDSAIITVNTNSFIFGINTSMTIDEDGNEYASQFHNFKRRHIFIRTIEHMREVYRTAVKLYLHRNRS